MEIKMPHQPDWDFYNVEMDDKSASVMLDLALAPLAPLAGKPRLLWIRVSLLQPDKDGLVQKQELDRLVELEQDIVARINQNLEGVLAGKVTATGIRDFYFYCSSTGDFDSTFAEIKKHNQDYEFAGAANSDPEWRIFWQVLYPSDTYLHIIQNRRVLRKLKEYGDKHTKPRKVDHWFYFQNDMDVQKFVTRVEQRGFAVEASETLPIKTDYPIQVNISRMDNVNEDYINQLTDSLLQLARECNGYYDGWETTVVKG